MTGDRVADPAVEAARRTVAAWRATLPFPPSAEADSLYDSLERISVEDYTTVAREALAPVRALHVPYETCNCCDPVPEPLDSDCVCVKLCRVCGNDWPCETARLIYREDEL